MFGGCGKVGSLMPPCHFPQGSAAYLWTITNLWMDVYLTGSLLSHPNIFLVSNVKNLLVMINDSHKYLKFYDLPDCNTNISPVRNVHVRRSLLCSFF